MATSAPKKVRDNTVSEYPRRKTPNFFGDPECLKSAGATTDDYHASTPQDSVNQTPPVVTERSEPHDGWPDRSTD